VGTFAWDNSVGQPCGCRSPHSQRLQHDIGGGQLISACMGKPPGRFTG
jgi:hypothetical protein